MPICSIVSTENLVIWCPRANSKQKECNRELKVYRKVTDGKKKTGEKKRNKIYKAINSARHAVSVAIFPSSVSVQLS